MIKTYVKQSALRVAFMADSDDEFPLLLDAEMTKAGMTKSGPSITFHHAQGIELGDLVIINSAHDMPLEDLMRQALNDENPQSGLLITQPCTRH